MGPSVKKKKNDLPDWMQGAVEVEETEALPDWLAGAELIEEQAPQPRFTEDMLDPYMEAPSAVRFELSGLPKQEDKLAALRKHYPDAEPYGDGNFAMTDPATGKVMIFNREGWFPSVGDFAEAAPLAAEIGGAIGGGILGGAKGAAIGGGTGAVAGSIIPAAGTAVGGISGATIGGVGGAIGGAGVGGATMRDLAERGINWYFGNEDTRTLGEYATDKAKDFAINAAGEGAGMAVAKGVGVAARPVKKWLAGGAEDAAKATQLADDLAKANVPSTVGTITQNPQTLVREAEIAGANPNSRVAQMQGVTDDAISQEHARIIRQMAANTDDTLRPVSSQAAGEGLMTKAAEANAAVTAQRNALYKAVDDTIGGRVSSGNDKTAELLARFNSEKKALGASAKLNNGSMLDSVIAQTKAAAGDMKSMTFAQMQEMRSTIGKLAFDPSTEPYMARRYKDLYEAMTADMAATAKSGGEDAYRAWRAADDFNAGIYAKDGTKQQLKGITRAADGEAAYSFTTGKVKDGGSRMAKTFGEIEKVPGGTAQVDQFTASYVQKMGTHIDPTTGAEAFSQKKFISNWNAMSGEAKDAAFTGARAVYREDLDRLSRIIAARQTASKAKVAPSDIGSKLIRLAGGVGSFGTSEAVRAGKTAYMDRLLTNPEVVRWMTRIPQAQVAKGGIGGHISALRNMGREAFRSGTQNGTALGNAIDQYLRDAGIEDEEKR